MYNIYKIDNDLYQIHSTVAGVKSKEGTQLAILTYAAVVLGFDPNQLQEAFLDMLENDFDSSHFGIDRTFIFAFNRNYDRVG